MIIANNFVTAVPAYTSAVCLRMDISSNIKVLNNSFNAIGATSANIYLNSYLSNIKFFNNIYHAGQGGQTYNSYGKLDTSIYSDYNAFYSTTDKNLYYNGKTYNLSEWKSMTSYETNSVFADPLYVNDSDLHIKNASALKEAGKILPEITVDIDDEPRSANARDIGADEFPLDSSSYFDIKLAQILYPDTLSCVRKDSLIIRIVNKSNFAITSFDAYYKLYNQTYPTKNFIVKILPKDTVNINLGYFPFAANTMYDFEFGIANPNQEKDNRANDNALKTKYTYLNKVKIYTSTTDDCSQNRLLYIKDFPRRSVLWSTGSDKDNIIITKLGTYSVTVTDNNGCKVTDSIIIK
jgi:hypothetical protein